MANLYQSTIPVLIDKLGNLRHIVAKGQAHANENGWTETAVTEFRLHPSMLPFAAQIRIPTDIASGCIERLSGKPRLSFEDSQNSFDELLGRIDQTIRFLESASESDFEDSSERAITIKTPMGNMDFDGNSYVAHFLFPNIYFHITAAYLILRHLGVDLGKGDYMQGAS